jgi:hypothetical protein
MTFTHPMYLQQQQQQQQQQQHQQLHQQQGASQNLGRNQSGSGASMCASGNNQFLPASAPVSSLLPPIPTQNNGQNRTASSLQSQLAALLSNSGYSNQNNGQYGMQQQQQQQNPYGNQMGDVSSDSQGAYSSNGGGGNAGMSNTMVPGMQNWNAERLGTSALL